MFVWAAHSHSKLVVWNMWPLSKITLFISPWQKIVYEIELLTHKYKKYWFEDVVRNCRNCVYRSYHWAPYNDWPASDQPLISVTLNCLIKVELHLQDDFNLFLSSINKSHFLRSTYYSTLQMWKFPSSLADETVGCLLTPAGNRWPISWRAKCRCWWHQMQWLEVWMWSVLQMS